jgi:hypothetical protein
LLVKQLLNKSNFLGTEFNSYKIYSPPKKFDLFVGGLFNKQLLLELVETSVSAKV